MFGKLLIALLLATVAVAAVARTSSGHGHAHVYVVRGGDTLWSIAAATYGGDPREGVWKIQHRNHMSDTWISPGERLVLP
jgi:nucleoid-associated protein YgaU